MGLVVLQVAPMFTDFTAEQHIRFIEERITKSQYEEIKTQESSVFLYFTDHEGVVQRLSIQRLCIQNTKEIIFVRFSKYIKLDM